jgi:hypothetical protein
MHRMKIKNPCILLKFSLLQGLKVDGTSQISNFSNDLDGITEYI